MTEDDESQWKRFAGMRRRLIVAIGGFWFIWLVNAAPILLLTQGKSALLAGILAALATLGELLILGAMEINGDDFARLAYGHYRQKYGRDPQTAREKLTALGEARGVEEKAEHGD
jgi:hypothetical protein